MILYKTSIRAYAIISQVKAESAGKSNIWCDKSWQSSCSNPQLWEANSIIQETHTHFSQGGGWIVFDWFWWSWGVFVASKELNCDFIWIEIEQKYVDMANKRLSQSSVSLF